MNRNPLQAWALRAAGRTVMGMTFAAYARDAQSQGGPEPGRSREPVHDRLPACEPGGAPGPAEDPAAFPAQGPSDPR